MQLVCLWLYGKYPEVGNRLSDTYKFASNPPWQRLITTLLAMPFSTTSACVPQTHPRRFTPTQHVVVTIQLYTALVSMMDLTISFGIRTRCTCQVLQTTSAVAASCSLRAFARLPAHAPVTCIFSSFNDVCHSERSEASARDSSLRSE